MKESSKRERKERVRSGKNGKRDTDGKRRGGGGRAREKESESESERERCIPCLIPKNFFFI